MLDFDRIQKGNRSDLTAKEGTALMRLSLCLVILLSLRPMRAGLGWELGNLQDSAKEGASPQGEKGNTEQSSQAQKRDKKPMTNDDVVGLVKAGIAENSIILDIRLNPTAFDTSPQALISLHRQGVSQGILDAMLTSGGGRSTPSAAPLSPTPVAPPSVGENGKLVTTPAPTSSTIGSETKATPPDLHNIRKVHLEIEWGEDDNARARATKAIKQHTCLQLVETPEGADAILSWETQGVMGVALDLHTKDGHDLWNQRGLTAPVKALGHAVGCPQGPNTSQH